MSLDVLTVSALNFYIKSIIDQDINLSNVFVEGEISNFKNHYSSGHLYFSIKDENSVIKCVMFNRSASRLKFLPENSMKVIVRGKVSVYDRDGQYQIYCEDMQPLGAGALALAFEQLKTKLSNEGLFDANTKRSLPTSVKRIAVVTSNTGAAIRDIISVSQRRNPLVELVICPVLVQGEGAADSIVKMLDKIYSCDEFDVIIIGRGGGSIEDLWCFNDERLIRKLYESPIPVVSAVGHETDFTLCDFVCDLRAPTPSAAAEIAVPDAFSKINDVNKLSGRLSELCLNLINRMFERLDRALDSKVFVSSANAFSAKSEQLIGIQKRLRDLAYLTYTNHQNNTNVLFKKLESLNPISVMSRGFSIASNKDGIISNIDKLKPDSQINVRFTNGTAECKVLNVVKE